MDFLKAHARASDAHHLGGFQAAGRAEGVLFIGRAQGKTGLFRTERRRNAEGKDNLSIVSSTGVVNHFYVSALDADFGPIFLKLCS